MSRPKRSKSTTIHRWSNEEKEYLQQITPGHHYKEIQELMNKKFNLNLTIGQVNGAIGRYKLNTGFTGHFIEGHEPANKGVKGVIYEGCKKTWFKKGEKPINYRPLGSERVTVDGYTEIKVAEPNEWSLKHRVIWEECNGPIPENHIVIFGDGDKSNFNINNLIMLSKHQLLIMNRHKLIKSDANLTRVGVVIADIYQKIGQRKNKK